MAFKLSKSDAAQADKIADDLDEAAETLIDAVSAFNAAMEEAFKAVEEAQARYTECVDAARSFADDVASEARSEWDDKSEKWQEGERGQAAGEWVEEWEGLDFDTAEIVMPDPIEEPDLGHAEMLRDARRGVED